MGIGLKDDRARYVAPAGAGARAIKRRRKARGSAPKGGLTISQTLLAGGESSADRGLARAFCRRSFRLSRFAKGLLAGGRFESCWIRRERGGERLFGPIAALEMITRALFPGSYGREVKIVFKGKARGMRQRKKVAQERREKARRRALADGESLWRLMLSQGVDFKAGEGVGQEFELYAWERWLDRDLRDQATRVWKRSGGEPKREGASFGLLEHIVASGEDLERSLALMEEIWPESCGRDRVDEAFGGVVEALKELAQRFKRSRGRGGSGLSDGPLREALSRSGLHIARERPGAMRPGNAISRAIESYGGVAPDELLRCEEGANAREQRGALEAALEDLGREAGGSRREPRRV